MNRFSPNDLITLTVNGEAFSCTSPIFLNQLLEYLDFNVKTIIVEHNSKIIDKKILNSIKLKSQDKIEIVTIVGGG